MKKVVIGLVGVAILVLTPVANVQAGLIFTEAGVKGGFNFANVSGDLTKTKSKTRIAIGGFATFDYKEPFKVQAELIYSQKGFKNTDDEDMKHDVSMTYIDIPIIFKYMIPTESEMKPSLYAGPYLSIRRGAKDKWSTSGESGSEKLDDGDSTAIKGTDIGFVLGGGLDIPSGNGKIVLDARYYVGSSDINDFTVYIKNKEIKNRTYALYIGYVLRTNM